MTTFAFLTLLSLHTCGIIFLGYLYFKYVKAVKKIDNNENLAMLQAENINANASTEDTLFRDIRDAIENNEFILHYQPQYSLNSDKVTGVEALVRWNHPEKGLVAPTDFIPLAESSGLIVPLGYWVLREACRQYKEWDRPDLKMSVNLSAYQFGQVDLVEQISKILSEEGMNPNNLNLEITETTSMADIETTLVILKELRDKGIHISIDDFGVGYSSLMYLKKFPITTLKIDRYFVWDISKDLRGEVVIKSIISMAKSLGLNIVAEGVETQEQLTFLDESFCDEIQGYILSPPVPSNKLSDMLNKNELKLNYNMV